MRSFRRVAGYAGGMTRFSFGPFVMLEDVRYACDALGNICHQHAAARV